MLKRYRFFPLIGAVLVVLLFMFVVAPWSYVKEVFRAGWVNQLAKLGGMVFFGTIVGAFLSMLLALFLTRISRKGSEPVKRSPDKGIGDWLLIMAIWFSLCPVFHAFGIMQHVAILKHYSPKFFFGFELLQNVLLFMMSLLAARAFFTERKNTPGFVIIYMLMGLGLTIIRNILLLVIHKSLSELFVFIFLPPAVALAFWIVVSAIWVPYFIFSKRVKATFCY